MEVIVNNAENAHLAIFVLRFAHTELLLYRSQGRIKQWAHWAVAPGPALLPIFRAINY